jgi:predicted lipoprotein with Yx(FWY)xxD motif
MTQPARIICRALAIATLSLSVCAHAETSGGFLAGKNGLTFYTYDDDVAGSGKSACEQNCIERWPAVPPNAASGKEFGSIQRSDGSSQLTYRGQPVYYYRYDHKPGDALGDGKSGLWHALRNTTPPTTQTDHNMGSNYGY